MNRTRASLRKRNKSAASLQSTRSVDACSHSFSEKRLKREATREANVYYHQGDVVNCYHKRETLGRGSFGIVYKCFSTKDNEYYAMKVVSKKRLTKKRGTFVMLQLILVGFFIINISY